MKKNNELSLNANSELLSNVEKVCQKAFDNICKTINSTTLIDFCYNYNPNCHIDEESINIAHAICSVHHVANEEANAYYTDYLDSFLIPESVINACNELNIDSERDMYEQVKKRAIPLITKRAKKIVHKKIAKETELHAFILAICEASYFAHRALNLDIPTEELIYAALEQMIIYLTDDDETDDEIIRRDIDFDKLPTMLQSIAERLKKEFKNCN